MLELTLSWGCGFLHFWPCFTETPGDQAPASERTPAAQHQHPVKPCLTWAQLVPYTQCWQATSEQAGTQPCAAAARLLRRAAEPTAGPRTRSERRAEPQTALPGACTRYCAASGRAAGGATGTCSSPARGTSLISFMPAISWCHICHRCLRAATFSYRQARELRLLGVVRCITSSVSST